jgi:hypothetical protein
MIACTKLFVIDDVRLVIFNGTLGFINLPFLLEGGRVVITIDLWAIAICEQLAPSLGKPCCGPVNAQSDLFAVIRTAFTTV